jgi:TfoX/Sxy family transcriptional regulator of competence genes
MAYDEKLAGRVRKALSKSTRIVERRMMGGLTFMVNGKMCVGVLKDDLMVRLDPVVYDSALKRQSCREMNFTGKPTKGFVFVGPKGTNNKQNLGYWVGLALDFNKNAKASKKRKGADKGHKIVGAR